MSDASSALPRQLILCCDGTNNNLTGGVNDTAVVKVCSLLADQLDDDQLMFYDPGVGNPGELPGATNWDQLQRRSERIAGLAFGRGVYENMAEGYLFLMRHYRPGDQIYILGFSRGAFTARSIAGLVNQFGVLQPHMEVMLPTLLHIYFSERGSRDAERDQIAVQARTLFASAQSRAVTLHFVGVWDTVASVGMWPFGAKFTAKPTVADKRFLHVRQALALDEMRAQFRPRLYLGDNGPHQTLDGQTGSLKQLWFRGAHCDVGGGYTRAQARLADAPLAWLLGEALGQGLRLRLEGQVLRTETEVAQALAQRHLGSTASAEPVIHSELCNTPLWALSGMEVRVTDQVLLDDGTHPPIQAVEHESVARWQPAFPRGSVWGRARPKGGLMAALVVMSCVLVLHGFLLSAPAELRSRIAHGEFSLLLQALDPEILWQANLSFAHWQQAWWLGGLPITAPSAFQQAGWALAADFVLIACYAVLLSWFAVRAFALRAGARRAGMPVSPWLNRLGWALPLAVFSDVGENLASYLTLALLAYQHDYWASVSGLLMSLLSVGKWLGLAGTLGLILWGLLPARRG